MKRDEYLILTAAVLALAITGCSMTPGITTDGNKAGNVPDISVASGEEDPVGTEAAAERTMAPKEEKTETAVPSGTETPTVPSPVNCDTPRPAHTPAPATTGPVITQAPAKTQAPAETDAPRTPQAPAFTPTRTAAPRATDAPRATAAPPARTAAPQPTNTAPPAENGDIWAWICGESGMTRIDKAHSPYDGIYVMGKESAENPEQNFSWGVLRDPSETEEGYNCTIYAASFKKEVRDRIMTVLKRAYPRSYAEVMDLVVKSIRQELWETKHKGSDSCRVSGTFGTRYLDDREVRISFTPNCSALYIFIFDKGYVNPEKPELLTSEEAEEKSSMGVGRSDSDFAKWFREVNGL